MLTYEEALRQVFAAVTPLAPVQIPLSEAAGLTLAGPVAAQWDMPRCDNSAMDGFAIADPAGDIKTPLEIIGVAYAGHPFAGTVAAGRAVRITTGATLPAGATTVVPLEEAVDRTTHLTLAVAAQAGQHVRYQGEEFRAGELLLEAGSRLHAGEIGLLACAGVEQVTVYPQPRVAIISTGDELVELGRIPGPGQIINSNLYLLMTRVRECGGVPIALGIGEDDPQALDSLITAGMEADLLISTGGVSVGEKDQVHKALARQGFQQKFWKVAIKPGKPVLFGTLGGKPCFGLPGNPAATAATFELFVKPALGRLAGQNDPLPARRSGVLATAVEGGGKRQAFLWCRLEWVDNGYRVTVPERQGSGQHRSIQGANALLAMPAGTGQLLPGDTVDVLVLRS